MGAVRQNVRLDILALFVRDDQVTILLGTKTPDPLKPLKPQQVVLQNTKGTPLSQGQPVELATIDGLSLSALTLNLKDYASPLIYLAVPGLGAAQAADAGTAVPFDATFPLLVNLRPSDTPTHHWGAYWVYPGDQSPTYPDGMQVVIGDGTQVASQMMAAPQYTGSVAEYLAFTVRTAAGQAEKMYLLTMADGSVKLVTPRRVCGRAGPGLQPTAAAHRLTNYRSGCRLYARYSPGAADRGTESAGLAQAVQR